MTTTRAARRPRLLAGAALALVLSASACGPTPGEDGATSATPPTVGPDLVTTSGGEAGDGQVVTVEMPGFDGEVPQPPPPPPVPLDEGGAELGDELPDADDGFEAELNPAVAPGGNNAMVAPGQQPGCSTQCISKAWVSSVAATADVDLEVITTAPAKLHVAVGTSSPVILGQAWGIVNPVVVDGNDALATKWTTRLGALDPSTKYHILVRAEDSSGNRSWRLGTFTTTAGGPSGGFTNDPSGAGCGAQCITKAWVTQVPGSSDLDIEVRTSHGAVIEVFASTGAPTYTQLPNGTVMPSFPGQQPKATTHNIPSTKMDATLTGLESDAVHTILVYATDSDGRRSFRIGAVRTGIDTVDVMVTFHQIHVEHLPRERIEFHFDVAGGSGSTVWPAPDQFSTGLLELGSGGTVKLAGANGSGYRHLVRSTSGEYYPSVFVQGIARDDGGMWKCAPVVAASDQMYGYTLDDCNTTWDTAGSGIGGTYQNLADCSAFAVSGTEPGDRCLTITTGNQAPGNGYPRFDAIVSFRIMD